MVEALAAARKRQRAIIWGLGGHVIKCGLGPVLMGGLSFTGTVPGPKDDWAPFGAASLVLPSLTALQSDGRSWLTASVVTRGAAGGGTAGGDDAAGVAAGTAAGLMGGASNGALPAVAGSAGSDWWTPSRTTSNSSIPRASPLGVNRISLYVLSPPTFFTRPTGNPRGKMRSSPEV